MQKFKKSLKNKITYFVLFIILIGLTQCELIFVDSTIWPERPPYFEAGDTLIFKSDSNDQHFYVEKAKLYAKGEYGEYEEEKNWDNEKFASSMTQFNCVDSCCSFGSVIEPAVYYVAFKKGINHASYRISDNDVRYSSLSLQIGKYKFNDLYGSYIPDFEYVNGKEIRSILYSKKYGVVQYKLTNGEVFTLLEECIAMMDNRH